jgi:hypothetical protein
MGEVEGRTAFVTVQPAAVRARHDAIVSSFDRWEQYCARLAAGEPGRTS